MVKRRNDIHQQQHKKHRWGILSIIFIIVLGSAGYFGFPHWHSQRHNVLTLEKKAIKNMEGMPTPAANTTTVQQNPANDTPAQKKLRAILLKEKLNGIVISTTRDSNEPIIVTNGMSNSITHTAFTSHTLFPISSFEKLYTGIIIDHLIADNKLTLNTRLDKFYPSIRFSNRISIQNLLSHTSGIQSGDLFPVSVLPDEASQLEYNRHIMRSTGIFKWSYSSVNYALLAGIITKITGESYQANVHKYIIEPLGLKESFFYNHLPTNPDIAYPEDVGTSLAQKVYLTNIKRIISSDYAAGDMFQSVGDFYKVLVATENGELVPKERLANFFPGGSKAYTNGMYIQYGLIHAAAANLSYYGSYYGSTKTLKNTVVLSTNGSLQTIRVSSVDLYHTVNH